MQSITIHIHARPSVDHSDATPLRNPAGKLPTARLVVDMQTRRRRNSTRAPFGNDDTASAFFSETSTASETTVGESERAIHPKHARRGALRDSQNDGRQHPVPGCSRWLMALPFLGVFAWLLTSTPRILLTYVLAFSVAHACALGFRKTYDKNCEILTHTSYTVGATCLGFVSASWLSPRRYPASVAPSSIAYLAYSMLAWLATPTWGLSSSDGFFGVGSGCMYTMVISYYNMDTMGWNIIHHAYLVLRGDFTGVVFITQIVSTIYQTVLVTSQADHMTREDAYNCKFMCIAVVIMTLIDMDRVDFESPGFQFPEWTPSLAIHALYLLPMYVLDPVRAMFDFGRSDPDRERLGLYHVSTSYSMNWLVAHMTTEFIYMVTTSLHPTAASNAMEIVKDACKFGCICRTTAFLWEREVGAGIFPKLKGYVLAFFVHGAVKIFTVASKYYSPTGVSLSNFLFCASCMYTAVVLRVASLRDSV